MSTALYLDFFFLLLFSVPHPPPTTTVPLVLLKTCCEEWVHEDVNIHKVPLSALYQQLTEAESMYKV